MPLYTKTGDRGDTGLTGGSRVAKNHARIQAIGDVDELNAAVGLAVAACADDSIAVRLRRLQDFLFIVGAQLADPVGHPSSPAIGDTDAATLEGWIDEAEGETTPLTNFVLPGGSELAARCHFARTVCRRGERSVITLSQTEDVSASLLVFLNRVSDLLFAWARLANVRAGVSDIIWQAPEPN